MASLTVTTGSESWSDHSARMSVFSFMDGSEVPLFVRARDNPECFASVGRPTSTIARPGMRIALGKWLTSSYDIRDGEVLKVFGQRHSGRQAPDIKAAFFIMPRANAALQHVAMGLSNVGAMRSAFVRGRFDIIDIERAARLGAVVAPHFGAIHDAVPVSRLFRFEQIEPEIAAPPVMERTRVRNLADEQVTVTRTHRRRNFQDL